MYISRQAQSPIHVLVYILIVSLFLNCTHGHSINAAAAAGPLRLLSCILHFICRGNPAAAATIFSPAQQLLLTNSCCFFTQDAQAFQTAFVLAHNCIHCLHTYCLLCRHKRPRTEVDPEAVLLKSGLDAGTAAAFLHESMLEFVDNEAMEETAQAYSYLSHAGANTLFACMRLNYAGAYNAMHAFRLCR